MTSPARFGWADDDVDIEHGEDETEETEPNKEPASKPGED